MLIAGLIGLLYFLTLSIALVVWLVSRQRLRTVAEAMLLAVDDAPRPFARLHH